MTNRLVPWVCGSCVVGCLLLTVGCRPALSSRSAHVVFANNLTFFGKEGGDLTSLQWQREREKNTLCPLVLHLPNVNLTAQDLADPKKLEQLGWQESYRDNAQNLVQYTWEVIVNGSEQSFASVTLEKGAVDRVLLRTTTSIAASVDGKRIILPIPTAQLESLLGKPLEVQVHDPFQGRVK